MMAALLSMMAYAQDSEEGYPQFGGIWDTDRGIVALWQAGDAVWGIYEGHGELGGHIDEDGMFRFWYEEDPADMGTGWFELMDTETLEGAYNSAIEMSEHGNWTGTFLGPNNYEVGDEEALNYDPENDSGSIVDSNNVEDDSGEGEESESETGGEDAEENPDPETESGDQDNESNISDTESAVLWTGTWNTGRGYLVLMVDDSEIYGSFGENGVFEGTIDGSEISAIWSVTNEDGSVTEGEALFYISEDGTSFRGTYNSSENPDLWLPWMGTKETE